MQELIADISRRRRRPSAPYIIGISGPDASGKTLFAKSLRSRLCREARVSIIHLDNFFYPTSIRYAGPDEVYNYLYKAIDFQLFENRILMPLAEGGRLRWSATLLDLQTDAYTYRADFDISPGDIVVLEGIFLFRRQWREYFDLRIYLSVEESTALLRGTERDAGRLGADVRRRYEDKYFPGYRIHRELDDPEGQADIVIDNNDYAQPRIMAMQLRIT